MTSRRLADFFMNANGGRYRESFVEYLVRVYSGTADPYTLARLCRRSSADLDAEYRDFMLEEPATRPQAVQVPPVD